MIHKSPKNLDITPIQAREMVKDKMAELRTDKLYVAKDAVARDLEMNPMTFDSFYYSDKTEANQMDKVLQDVQNQGFGIYNIQTKKRVNIEDLSVIRGDKKIVRNEMELLQELKQIEKVFDAKFNSDKNKDNPCGNPYCLELFNKDPGLFVERLIRATEICSLRWVLNRGGALNTTMEATIVKGRKKFLWEV